MNRALIVIDMQEFLTCTEDRLYQKEDFVLRVTNGLRLLAVQRFQ